MLQGSQLANYYMFFQKDGSEIKLDMPEGHQRSSRCPLNNASGSANPLTSYETFLERSAKFRELNSLPVPFGHFGEFTVEDLAENKASWHRSCHKKFDNDKLKKEESWK